MRPKVTDEQRATEAVELAARLNDAVAKATAVDPSDARAYRAAWGEVAMYAGNVQRRARLLAGLGRGG